VIVNEANKAGGADSAPARLRRVGEGCTGMCLTGVEKWNGTSPPNVVIEKLIILRYEYAKCNNLPKYCGRG